MSSRGMMLFGVLASLLGCSEYGARPRSPAQGGPTWVEVSSPHFDVITNLLAKDAEGVAREFEDELDAIEQVEFAHPRTLLGATTIVVFNDASDFHAFVPRLLDGEFRRRLPVDLEPSRFLLLHGAVTPETRVICLHELTHDLFERNFGPAPPWLNEGWAQYYSTIEVKQDTLRAGGALPNLSFTEESAPFTGRFADGTSALAMPIAWVPPASALIKMDRPAFYEFSKDQEPNSDAHLRGIALYLGAWALVHMMHDGPEEYTARYKRFLEKVQDEQVQPAWDSAFAGISAAEFDHDFRVFMASRHLMTFVYPRNQATLPTPLTKRALSDAEVRILWSRLSSADAASSAAALQDLDAALLEAPDSPDGHYYRGLYWLHRKKLALAEQDLVEAARLAPTDPRFLLGVLVLRIEQSPEAEMPHAGDPITQALAPLARVATSGTQLRITAQVYNDLGDHERALGFARRASALSPIDSLTLDTEAQVLSSLGRNEEALALQRSAVAFLPEGATAPDVVKRLHAYEARAGRGP